MNDPWQQLIERRIEEAQRRGDFDRLRGRGRPLQLPDLSDVPPELRSSYILLDTHGFIPPELEARKAWLRLEDLLAAATESTERDRLRAEARRAQLRYRMLVERRGGSVVAAEYRDRVLAKLERPAAGGDAGDGTTRRPRT